MSDGSGKVENWEGPARFIAYEGAAPFPLFSGRFDTRKAEREGAGKRSTCATTDAVCGPVTVVCVGADPYTDSTRSLRKDVRPTECVFYTFEYPGENILLDIISNFGSLSL
ncbi:unnamed protein product [Lasius platythorax]|uniref:Uncharacterized protein n=1 Tax=Lasius platythorax TaxID=488582 RepID=A0AAV2NLA3_9HYME